jgi:alkylation response protein AidB-like acyl-CoA dehydrogenase
VTAALGLATGFVLDEAVADSDLSAGDRSVRDRVREIVERDVAPQAAELDRTGAFPEAGYRALASAGLAGLLIAPEHGGSGQSTVAYAAAVEEIAAACGSTSLVYMTQMHAAFPIEAFGTAAQKRRHLPRLCSGEIYGSIAITEPDGGSDVAALRTSARPTADGWHLSGSKTFITTGDRAGVVVVFATVDASPSGSRRRSRGDTPRPPGAGRDGITAFLVEPPLGGVTAGPALSKLGMRGSSTVELSFDVDLPADAVLGPLGGGFGVAMRSVVKTRISAAAQGLGLARGALNAGVVAARRAGLLDPSTLSGQAIQAELAQLRTEVAAGRTLLRRTAALVDAAAGDETGPARLTAEVAEAKLFCTDLGVSVADRVVDLLGPAGDVTAEDAPGSTAERCLRDAKVTQIYDGTNQIQRVLIARDTSARFGS